LSRHQHFDSLRPFTDRQDVVFFQPPQPALLKMAEIWWCTVQWPYFPDFVPQGNAKQEVAANSCG
jgi:hypothetical protein